MIHSKKILRIITDVLALNLSYLLVCIYFIPNALWVKDTVTLGVIINLLWFATLAASNKLYGRFEYTRFRVELKSVLKNYFLHFVFFSSFVILIFKWKFSFMLLFYAILFFAILSLRFIMHLVLPKYSRIQNLNYITVGYCEALPNVEKTIKDAHLNKVKYFGSFGHKMPSPYKKIGDTAQLIDYLKEHPYINQILYASTELSASNLRKLINFSKLNFIDFKLIPLEIDLLQRGVKFELHDGCPLLSVQDERIARIRNRLTKRVFDVLFSLFVIIFILSFLVPIIALLIKLESKGPVFFSQQRRGLKNKKFKCYKFRSMVVNNEADTKQATKSDARITKVGAFIRKTNIDELPQFFNVLVNDMSVVGPRPHPLQLDENLSEEMEEYILRYYTKPGVTGWAQVNGFRGPTETTAAKEGRTSHDIWYLRNWTFLLDIRIIFLTIFGSKVRENAF